MHSYFLYTPFLLLFRWHACTSVPPNASPCYSVLISLNKSCLKCIKFVNVDSRSFADLNFIITLCFLISENNLMLYVVDLKILN